MQCKTCGALISEDSKYCKICGAPQVEIEGAKIGNTILRKIPKVVEKTFNIVGQSVEEAVNEAIMPQVNKAVTQKSKKMTDKALKAVGLKHKTMFDKIKEKKKK